MVTRRLASQGRSNKGEPVGQAVASLPYVQATLVFLEIRAPFWEVDGLPGSRLPGERVVLEVLEAA